MFVAVIWIGSCEKCQCPNGVIMGAVEWCSVFFNAASCFFVCVLFLYVTIANAHWIFMGKLLYEFFRLLVKKRLCLIDSCIMKGSFLPQAANNVDDVP